MYYASASRYGSCGDVNWVHDSPHDVIGRPSANVRRRDGEGENLTQSCSPPSMLSLGRRHLRFWAAVLQADDRVT